MSDSKVYITNQEIQPIAFVHYTEMLATSPLATSKLWVLSTLKSLTQYSIWSRCYYRTTETTEVTDIHAHKSKIHLWSDMERKRWMQFLWNKFPCFKWPKYFMTKTRDNHVTVHTAQTGIPTLREINDSNRLMSSYIWNLEDLSGSESNEIGALMVSSAKLFSAHFPIFHLINITLFQNSHILVLSAVNTSWHFGAYVIIPRYAVTIFFKSLTAESKAIIIWMLCSMQGAIISKGQNSTFRLQYEDLKVFS